MCTYDVYNVQAFDSSSDDINDMCNKENECDSVEYFYIPSNIKLSNRFENLSILKCKKCLKAFEGSNRVCNCNMSVNYTKPAQELPTLVANDVKLSNRFELLYYMDNDTRKDCKHTVCYPNVKSVKSCRVDLAVSSQKEPLLCNNVHVCKINNATNENSNNNNNGTDEDNVNEERIENDTGTTVNEGTEFKMFDINICSLNVAGWTANNSALREEIIKNSGGDLICIQESHCEKGETLEVEGYTFYSHPRSLRNKSPP